jgi:hypothetical protein
MHTKWIIKVYTVYIKLNNFILIKAKNYYSLKKKTELNKK